MKTPPHRTYPVTQLACIVNLLHRMAIHAPPEALPGGMIADSAKNYYWEERTVPPEAV